MPRAFSPSGRRSSPARRSRSHRGEKSPTVWKQSRGLKNHRRQTSAEAQVGLRMSTTDSFQMGQKVELLQQEPQSRDDAESCYEHIRSAGSRAQSAEEERLRVAREEREKARARARNLASPMRWSRDRGARMVSRSRDRSRSPLTGQERVHSHPVRSLVEKDGSPSPPIQHLETPMSPRREFRHSMNEPPVSAFGRELQRVAKEDAWEAMEDAKALAKISNASDKEKKLYDLNAELYELKAEKVRLEMKLFMNAEGKYSVDDQTDIDRPSVPILSRWGDLSNGQVRGTIYFSPDYKDGDQIQTSAVLFGGKPRVYDGTLIQTQSGRMYFLDKFYDPPAQQS